MTIDYKRAAIVLRGMVTDSEFCPGELIEAAAKLCEREERVQELLGAVYTLKHSDPGEEVEKARMAVLFRAARVMYFK